MSTHEEKAGTTGVQNEAPQVGAEKQRSVRKHPASFPSRIIDAINAVLEKHEVAPDIPNRLLDPFVGIGGVAKVKWEGEILGIELEIEWAEQAAETGIETYRGDSRDLPWEDGHFGAICTSPTYGNRLADSYLPDLTDAKHSKSRSYTIYLGKPLTDGSSGAMHWGDEYREFHATVWAECVRVLHGGGLFILNVKDHSRSGVRQRVTRWHVETLKSLGLEVVDTVKVPLRGDQNTATMRKKGIDVVDFEWVIALRKP